MAVNIITHEDLQDFKQQLFEELRQLFPTTTPVVKRWFRSYEVREMLNISPGTLQNLRINNTLHPQKIGGIHFYDSEEISRILQPDLRESSRTNRRISPQKNASP